MYSSGACLSEKAAYKNKFLHLTETSFDAIVIVNECGVIVHWNDAARETFGYEREEAVGQSIEMIVPERHKTLQRKRRKDFVRSGTGRLTGEESK